MADEQAAVSSTATIEAPLPKAESFTEAERSEWLQTGKVPDAAPPDVKAPEPKAEESAPLEETPAAATQEAAPDAGTGDQQQPKKESGPARRSAEIEADIQRLQEALRTRAELRRQLQTEPAKPGDTPAPPAAPAELKRPKIDDFQTFDEYEAALDKYTEAKIEHSFEAKLAERQAKEAEAKQQQEMKAQSDKFWEGIREAAKDHPDYADVVFDKSGECIVQVNPTANKLIAKLPAGPRILYHLAKNPAEAQRILSLDPEFTAVEIAELNLQFKGKKTETAAALPKVTSAPPPPTTLKGGSSTPTADEQIADALRTGDTERYRKLMNARELASKG